MKYLYKLAMSTFLTPVAISIAAEGGMNEIELGSAVHKAKLQREAKMLGIEGAAAMDVVELASKIHKVELERQAQMLGIL